MVPIELVMGAGAAPKLLMLLMSASKWLRDASMLSNVVAGCASGNAHKRA